jgi:hypothetical protein
MKRDWLDICLELANEPADFYSGARKILRSRSFTFKHMKNDLQMADAGYTKSKMTMLTKNYLHHESRSVAIDLWNKRIGQRKYGSVSFTCFAHFVKGGTVDAKRSKRASVFGPCIQSVSLTYLNDHTTAVDVFYRTTELFKKFPADLVFFRDVLLAEFDFSNAPIREVTFHFANITCHPMYFVTLIPLLDDPIEELEAIRNADAYFFNWIVKWTSRYIVPKHHRGIQRFAQAMRVCDDARARIKPQIMKPLVAYLDKWHPGYRNDYVAPEEDDE